MATHYGMSDKELDDILLLKKVYINTIDDVEGGSLGIGPIEKVIETLHLQLGPMIRDLENNESMTITFTRLDLTKTEYESIPVS